MTALIVIFVKELKAAIKGHAIEATSLTGMFGAKDNPWPKQAALSYRTIQKSYRRHYAVILKYRTMRYQ